MVDVNRLAAQFNLGLLRRVLPHVSPGGRSWLARNITRHRTDLRARILAEFCSTAVHAFKNRQYDVSVNGEEALLERLAVFKPQVVVDVGANVGDWTLAACRHLPEAMIHAFEITPPTAKVLRDRTSPFPNARVNPFGLGDADADITVYTSPESSTAASTLREAIEVSAREHGIRNVEEIASRITTGDRHMREHGIERIDVLKIDVEGAEFSVLRGFADAFERQAIDVVQFEYGKINLATRDFLADYYAFFIERGFVVGKLFPEGVAFKPYSIDDEDFLGPNYVACRLARTDVIRAIGCDASAVLLG